MSNARYISYKKYGLRFDFDTASYSVYYDGFGEVMKNVRVAANVTLRDPQPWPDGYDAVRLAGVEGAFDSVTMSVVWPAKDETRQPFGLKFTLSDNGVCAYITGDGSAFVKLEGEWHWGDHCQCETMAVNLNSSRPALRGAYGPAAGDHDNALFDRDTDSAIVVEASGIYRVRFDWEKKAYVFTYDMDGKTFARGMNVKVETDVYERKFGYEYKKVNPNSTFRTPPVGWMSWYSVQFDAGDKTVLANTEWQAKYLKKYGANAIWVDWEWYHPDFTSQAPEGVDMFHPNPKMYPHGLAYIAEKIKENGFTPALWIGPTCDSGWDEELEKHPDTLMCRRPMWSGQYFFDPTHPTYINEILPRMVRQAPEWGYEAIKWDVLPNTLSLCDEYRETRYDPNVSSRDAMKRIFEKAREVLGKDYYMLYCAGVNKRDMDLACTVFDAARIGGDIFRWEEFNTQCIDKLCEYYALHTVVCNNDPDNVVIREKFNTMDQAVTRASIVSLLGLPMTLGDDLPELPEERVDILRRTIPPVPAHPMDIRSTVSDHRTIVVNLAIDLKHMRYNVADVINLKEEPSFVHVSLKNDLDLDDPAKKYYVYDYWNREFIGVVTDGFDIEMRAHQSRVFAVRPVEDKAQLLATSRHVSMGAIDVLSLEVADDGRTLKGRSKVVGGDTYEVVACAPDDLRLYTESDKTSTNETEYLSGNAWRCTFHPAEDGEFEWSIAFTPKTKR